MNFDGKLESVKGYLRQAGIDGWLMYDYQKSNPIVHEFLRIDQEKLLSRRFFYWIPQEGLPLKIVPSIEPYTLDHLPGDKRLYSRWQELEADILSIARPGLRIAMEYSPRNALPNISKVDRGIVELVESRGAEVISSADLLQQSMAVLDDFQMDSHIQAAAILEKVAAETWVFIEEALQRGCSISEYDVQQYMTSRIQDLGGYSEYPLICAVNAHSSDPHYHPEKESAQLIQKGDFVLIDLFCKQAKERAIYADITRVAVVLGTPTKRQRELFDVVRAAQRAVKEGIEKCYHRGERLQGWQADRLSRAVIEKAGWGAYFIHRTGHNIGEKLHGHGTNLDDFETHDERQLLPRTVFSVEPAIYLPGEFGMRLEYDIYLDAEGKPHVTGGEETPF